MKGLEKKHAQAIATFLNLQIQNKVEVELSAKAFSEDAYYVGTTHDKIRIFAGDDEDLYKLHLGGTIETPGIVIKGNTYDGIAKLFDPIEIINN